MNDTIILAEKLKESWRELSADVQKNKKISIEMFDSTFSQTYALLAKHLAENSLDKRFIELIAEAYLFANIKDEAVDYTCLAAFVLTERMLTYCAFGNTNSDPSVIYIVETRRAIRLDFNDVGESLSKLTRVFEDMYWKNVQQ